MSAQDYLKLITSEHQGKPNFAAMILSGVSPMVQVQALLKSLTSLFDIDTPPVGVQLDVIGQWVGVSRKIEVPIPGGGIYFTWNSSALLGWDSGIWPPIPAPTNLSILPDDSFLILIRAKIAANHWDGTTEGAYKIWNILFPNINLLIQDNQDMSMVIAVQGQPLDALSMALLTGGYLPLKPEGVHINEYIVPIDTNQLFGWDIENSYIQGWNAGSWGMELVPT